jgi:hypothetical protein
MKLNVIPQVLLVVTGSICFLIPPAFAQGISSKPDRQGDYRIHRSVNWEVKSSSLNCRNGAGNNYTVVTVLNRGSRFVLHTELEGLPISLDKQRKPWLRVKYDGTGENPCFVRANSQFIVPMVEGCGRWNPIRQSCYCGFNEWLPEEQRCVAE